MVPCNFATEILNEKLLVSRVKPKTRRQIQLGKRVHLWYTHFPADDEFPLKIEDENGKAKLVREKWKI